jgi:hypothetical protein
VERALRIVHSRIRSTVGIANDTFAEVICLHLACRASEVVSRPFPIDLVKIVGHHNRSSNDTDTRSDLSNNVNAAKVYVEASPNVRCIVTLGEGEVGAIG